MLRKLVTLSLSVLLVLTLLSAAVQPVLAEAPPPPSDSPGGSGAPSAPKAGDGGGSPSPREPQEAPDASPARSAAPAEVSAPAIDFSQWAPPPVLSAAVVAPATQATFTADEQMLDSSGVMRAQGETLAAFMTAGALACPLGKVPTIYGGLNDTGCTPYYEIGASANPLQDAHNNGLTKATWWIWLSPNYPNAAVPSTLSKSVTVAGDPRGTSVTGGIAMNAANITLRELIVQGGKITSTLQLGTLRLQGVTVRSAPVGHYGIDIVEHKGSLILSNVYSSENSGGAWLNTLGGTGTVTVLNSSFDNNSGLDGLVVQAKNALRIENVSFTFNNGYGLSAEYRTRLTLKNIIASENEWGGIVTTDSGTIPAPVLLQNITANNNKVDEGINLASTGAVTGNNIIASGNKGNDGIQIYPGRGAITLTGVIANNNLHEGIDIETTGAVTINGARLEGNGLEGAYIGTKAAVTVRNAVFYDNGDGLYIENDLGTLPAVVTLTNLDASDNDYFGIYVSSLGAVTLSGISALFNGCNGAQVDTLGVVNVTATSGANSFNDNGWADHCSGLYIVTDAAITVTGITANDNAYDGLGLFNWKTVRATNITANANGESGLNIGNYAAVTLDRVTTLYNGYTGVYVDNTVDEGMPVFPVALTHVVANFNKYQGIQIDSGGAVTLNHFTANRNNDFGVRITNDMGGRGVGNVTLTNTLGNNLLVGNGNFNLFISTKGSALLNGVNASGSQTAYGARIQTVLGTGNVTITNSSFNENGDDVDMNDFGLLVQSKGLISLNTVTVNNNKGYGAQLWNDAAPILGKTVTVAKSTFNENEETGLYIASKSTVTLHNLTANWNDGAGVEVDNYRSGAGVGNISILSTLGPNQFNGNDTAGLYLTTGGSVAVSKTQVNDNGFAATNSGIYVFSYGIAKTALFTCVSAARNAGFGLDFNVLAGTQKLTLQGVWLYNNGVLDGLNLNPNTTPLVVTRTVCQ